MSEENQNTESPKPSIDLPKFELPKAAAPTIKTGDDFAKPAVSPVIPSRRPSSFGASAAVVEQSKAESPIWLVVDALAAAVAVAFAVLIFLDK